MTGNDKSNVLVLKDESKRRQKQAPATPKAKRGRPLVNDDDAAFQLVSEVEEERKAGILKKKEAIASLIGDAAPHSWWWDKNAPLGFSAAHKKYYRALERLESYEKEHGRAYEPMSLAKLGEKAGIKPPERPAQPIEQRIEEATEAALDHKRWLYENKDAMSSSRLLDRKRDCRRSERQLVKLLKEYAASIGKRIATDGPKYSPEEVKRAMERLKELDAHIADFEEKMTKIEDGGH